MMAPPSPRRTLTRPVWIVGHLLALTAVVGFVLLGQWQLRRHQERGLLDDRIRARVADEPRPLAELVAELGTDGAALDLRPATAAGTYRPQDEVILQARTLNGRSGNEVLTPLDLGDGSAVLVDRGWVPLDVVGPPVEGAEVPSGPVTVAGYLRPTQTRSGFGPVDPATGVLERVIRVDLDRLQQQIDLDLGEVYLVLAEQSPAQAGDFPIALPAPQPGGGPPHLSYAVQWFAFAGVVLVGYPILLRRRAGHRPADRGTDSGRLPP
ncbi:MAG: SURF1 family protein [Actinomycetota bacterium]|nr:SURF1 family protein [Actinomycetota bacterium]